MLYRFLLHGRDGANNGLVLLDLPSDEFARELARKTLYRSTCQIWREGRLIECVDGPSPIAADVPGSAIKPQRRKRLLN